MEEWWTIYFNSKRLTSFPTERVDGVHLGKIITELTRVSPRNFNYILSTGDTLTVEKKKQQERKTNSDIRPVECRFRLQEERKAYPKSSCNACGRNVMAELGSECHYTQSKDEEIRKLRKANEILLKGIETALKIIDEEFYLDRIQSIQTALRRGLQGAARVGCSKADEI